MLETQLNELQAERLKIYSSQAQKGKAQVNVFPPISHSPQNQAQQQPHPHPQRQQTNSPEPPGGVHPAVAMLNHIEKLRNNLKEREYEVHSLRHENSTLKQVCASNNLNNQQPADRAEAPKRLEGLARPKRRCASRCPGSSRGKHCNQAEIKRVLHASGG